MAQRGGAVQSHLRYGDSEIYSDIVPTGRADLILSVEPLEVLRYWHYLRPGGWVVTSVTPYVNIPDYPEMDDLLAELAGFENIVMVDTANIARAAGNLRAQNMAAVGAASPLLDFSEDQLLRFVELLFSRKGEKIVDVNQRAFSFRPGGRSVLPGAGGWWHAAARCDQAVGQDRGRHLRPGPRPGLGRGHRRRRRQARRGARREGPGPQRRGRRPSPEQADMVNKRNIGPHVSAGGGYPAPTPRNTRCRGGIHAARPRRFFADTWRT